MQCVCVQKTRAGKAFRQISPRRARDLRRRTGIASARRNQTEMGFELDIKGPHYVYAYDKVGKV